MNGHNKSLNLGGCYHTGLAYCLAYDANGETELCDKIFTNLNTGLEGGAMAALKKHEDEFDASRDIPKFIIALKPVLVIRTLGDDETNEEETECSHCSEKADEDCCCHDYDECDEECCSSCDCGDEEDDLCNFDSDESCFHCGENLDDCDCERDEDCDEDLSCCICGGEDCGYEDEFDHEFVSDTFSTMNAFERARWIAAQKKGN